MLVWSFFSEIQYYFARCLQSLRNFVHHLDIAQFLAELIMGHIL